MSVTSLSKIARGLDVPIDALIILSLGKDGGGLSAGDKTMKIVKRVRSILEAEDELQELLNHSS